MVGRADFILTPLTALVGKDVLETLSFLFKSIDFDPSKRVRELVHEK